MPFGFDKDKPKKQYDRIETDNKQELPDGTRLWEILDVWVYNVRKVMKPWGEGWEYCGDPTENQHVQIKLGLVKRPDIKIKEEMPLFIGPKAKFAKFAKAHLGVQPGQSLIDYLTPGDEFTVRGANSVLKPALVGKHVMTTNTRSASGWIKVGDLVPPLQEDDDLDAIPLQTNPKLQKQPLTEAQRKSEEFDDSSIREDFIGQREPKVVGGDRRFPFKAAKLPEEKLSGSIFDEFDTGEPAPPNPEEPAYAQGLEEDVPF